MTNFTLAVKSIKSIDDSTELGSDQPYVLVVAVNLTSFIPAIQVTLYGPWGSVSKGELASTLALPPNLPQSAVDLLAGFNVIRQSFWGLNRQPAPIDQVSDVAFFVCVMENDDGAPMVLRTLVKAAAIGGFLGAIPPSLPIPTAVPNANQRKDIINAIAEDIKGALKTPTGFPNFDDVVGVQQLVLQKTDLVLGTHDLPVLHFAGGKEGTFNVTIEMVGTK
jgi:hypothetical protein